MEIDDLTQPHYKDTPDGKYEVIQVGTNNGELIFAEHLIEPSQAWIKARELERLQRENEQRAKDLAEEQRKSELLTLKATYENTSLSLQERMEAMFEYTSKTREI